MKLTALRPVLQPSCWVTKGGTLIQTRVDSIIACPINLVLEQLLSRWPTSSDKNENYNPRSQSSSADLRQPWYTHCPGSPVVCMVATDCAVA